LVLAAGAWLDQHLTSPTRPLRKLAIWPRTKGIDRLARLN
jgi:hypothetical protein